MAKNITKCSSYLQPTDINGNPIGGTLMINPSLNPIPPTNPFKGPKVSVNIRSEKIEFIMINEKTYAVRHSDYFIDFIVEEFGQITIETKFDDMVVSYEMFFDVIDEPTKLNFKKRFVIEKYLDKE